MDIAEIIGQLAGALGSSGIIAAIVMKRIDKLERMLDKREGDRVEENLLRGEVLRTTSKLTEANTAALRTVTTEEACRHELSEHRIASERLEKFLRKKSAEYLHAN